MSPVFLVPYFSGAVNYQLPDDWQYVEQEIKTYKTLSSQEKINYEFIKESEKTVIYNNNYNGLVYIIMFSNLILPFIGDVAALEILQISIHIIISLIILSFIKGKYSKIAFLCLYSLNPLIIYFVTFPFYYFWQVLATVLLLPYLFNEKFKYSNWIFVITPILALAFLNRPATLLCLLLFFLLYSILENKWRSICCFLLFIALINIFSEKRVGNSQVYWHTVFIGMGAYPNPYIKTLSDVEGFTFFYKQTGKYITNTLPNGNFHTDLTLRNLYLNILRNNYIQIAQDNPLLLLKNAILNFFQSFSLGYFVDYPLWVSYLSAVLGFVFCILLLIKKQYLWIIAIAASTITFTPYYPPIQAYMFGSYVLIVGAFISLLKRYAFFGKIEAKIEDVRTRFVAG